MDPLAQLQDIELPNKINNYPIAIGWWLLAIICIGLILFVAIKVINRKKRQRSQKIALLQLTSTTPTTEDCVASLKWAALQYFPRVSIANLYGENFHQFLITTLPNKYQEKFKVLSSDSLQKLYQKPIDLDNESTESSGNNSTNNDDFYQASLIWLNHALPPKPKTTTVNPSDFSAGNS